MANEKRNEHPKRNATLPEGQGESAGRRKGLAEEGGTPLTKELEDGQLRGANEDGRHDTGTHGGPDPNRDGREGTRLKH
jgi:hypothetical protein